MINIGKYIETAINWLTENFAPLFDAINVGIGGFIDGFQNILMWIPFYVTIALLAILAWYKSGKGVSIFTILGLLLIWGMGFSIGMQKVKIEHAQGFVMINPDKPLEFVEALIKIDPNLSVEGFEQIKTN